MREFKMTEKDFITIKKPIKMWEISYDGQGGYIEPKLCNVIEEIKNAIENGEEQTFNIKQIKMSMFEFNKLPEFKGF